MYFTTELRQMSIIFEQWRVTTISGVSGSIVAVLALAVLYECTIGLHVYLRSRLKNQKERRRDDVKMKNRIHSEYTRSETFTQFLKTCLFSAELFFAYFLMLITMTYNTWLFSAVVIGRGLGFYLVTPLITSYVDREETDDFIDISMDSLSTRHQQL
ncbi:probable low affinity copper uptake protein 2 [Stylophora pistillata]|uniref:probable low affinity copper uptake protein 2 n=1 Tax=Stylophora pistillata TaxID=50429 RepID=UPI000C03CEA8|nr:probable low affinity copper uptake protein 2 [Stylophora pistillata]